MNNQDKAEFIQKKLLHLLMLEMIHQMMIQLNILMIQPQVQEHMKFQSSQRRKNLIKIAKQAHLVFQARDLSKDLNKLQILVQVNIIKKFKQGNLKLKQSKKIKMNKDSLH